MKGEGMGDIIHTEGLTKRYGRLTALNALNMTLREGEIYGLIGRNGAGKSTFLNMILGITLPSAGEIEIFGEKSPVGLMKARTSLGALTAGEFFPNMTARENLSYYATLRGVGEKKKEIDRVLRMVDLDKEKKAFRKYSLGMKRRLGVALALMGSPRAMILDEPTNGLDPIAIVEFRELLKKLNREEGMTILVSSHILSELSMTAKRFGIIETGELKAEITEEALRHEMKNGVLVTVDRPEEALNLMKEKGINGEISGESILTDGDADPADIARILVTEGFSLKELRQKESNLEDFFLKTIGGVSHV